jgi:hypothetical protein
MVTSGVALTALGGLLLSLLAAYILLVDVFGLLARDASDRRALDGRAPEHP